MECLNILLNDYVSRDAIIRTCSYASLLLSEYSSKDTSRKLKIISTELSYCRLLNRLFDDVSMLKYTLQYGLGSKENGKLLRLISVLLNIVDQLYFPVEHFAWAADKKIIAADSSILYNLSSGLWALSCYLNILRSLLTLSRLESCKNYSDNELLSQVSRQQLGELLVAFRSSADFVIAISYLPPGTLMWAGKLSTKKIAWCGLLSSILRLVLFFRNMP
ncbi:peroxisomal membrane protein 11C [Parasteatoda tepidariorum]|uniref:peroxisomal membrane protein 11C n=1 Tax=Parasteatoda tepidariorum TaxID=114398 RepID=UPI00077FBB5C|nr:peroxisomal membrane protein 11C [Parasteatoda tepidariorum]